jgi:putative hemolysin
VHEVAIILLLILINAFFSAAELALVSARKSRLRVRADEGHRGARVALQLLDDPTGLLSSVQIGITAVGIFTGVYSGVAFAPELAEVLRRVEWLAPYAQQTAFAMIVTAVTFVSLIFGELVPKRFAYAHADRLAMLVAVPMQTAARLGAPLVWLLRVLTDGVVRLLPATVASQSAVNDDDIRALVAEGTRGGVVHKREKEMIDAVLRLADSPVESIMVPRGSVLWLDEAEPLAALWEEARKSGHARFLLCRGELEQLLGVVSLANLGEALRRGKLLPDVDVQPPLHVPAGISVLKLLDNFQRSSVHLAVVTDEYGGITGLVTPADILRAIAGGIPDMGSRALPGAVQRDDGSWLVDGALPIYDAERILGRNDLAHEDDFHTLAGFVLWRLGRLPKEAEKMAFRDLEIEVVDMDGIVIDKLIVRKRSSQALRAGS